MTMSRAAGAGAGPAAGNAADGLTFALLGPVRAWRGARELELGQPQQRVVLVSLLLQAGRSVPVDAMVDAVWGYAAPPSARGVLHGYVHRLRRVLGAGVHGAVITSGGGGYALTADQISSDVDVFQREVAAAAAARAAGALPLAAVGLASAVGLWQGPALAGLPGVFAESERARLRQAWLAAVEELAEVDLELGGHREVVARLTPIVADEPLRERLHELLIVALCCGGRQAEALAAYEQMRVVLREELGVDPGPGLQELYRRMLDADPALLTAGAAAATAAPVTMRPAQLPADLPVFSGRHAVLGEVLDACAGGSAGDDAPLSVAVVHGMAGVGKTAFAVHWAHRVADQFPDGQLYVNLRGFEADAAAVDPADAVWRFLEALGVPGPSIPTDPDARTALYRSVLAERRCLIVLDNARDAGQVLPLLPGGPSCLVLVTSRSGLPGVVAVTGARSIELDVLTPAEAEEFLTRRVGPRRVAAEPEAAHQLIELCARLPLALAIICTRAANHPAFTLSAVAAELRQARGSLDAFSDTDGAADVRAVLSWSYRALPPPAARLFRLLSLHPGADVTVPAAASLIGQTPSQTRALLRRLTGTRLSSEHLPGRFNRHDLVGVYAAELLDSHDAGPERDAASRRMLDHYLHTACAAGYQLNRHRDFMALAAPAVGVHPQSVASYQDALAWFGAEHAVLQTLMTHAIDTGFPDHAWQLAWFMIRYLDWQGHRSDFAATQYTGLRAAYLSANKTGMGYAHRGISRVEFNNGHLPESLGHLEQALALFEQEGDTLAMAYTCRQDAGIRALVGDHDRALANGQRALALFRAAGERAGEAGALVATAWALKDLGRGEEAIAYCQQAIAIYEQTGVDHGRATAFGVMGQAYRGLGRYDEAIANHLLALDDDRNLGGPRLVAASLLSLGKAYQEAGRLEEAEAVRREADALVKRLDLPEGVVKFG